MCAEFCAYQWKFHGRILFKVLFTKFKMVVTTTTTTTTIIIIIIIISSSSSSSSSSSQSPNCDFSVE